MIDKGFKDLSQVAIWGPLLIAGLILGCEPSPTDGSLQESPGQPWFEEVAQSSGLSFEHETGKTGRFLMPEVMVGGGALFDMDNDGDLDAYLVQSGSFVDEPAAGPVNRLFRNRGDGKFDDVTTNSGADHRGYGSGVAAGDYNNDGLVDLYVTNVGPNMLLRNDGAGHFTDVTEKTGVGDLGWGTSTAFLDYDNDGDLDLYVVNYIRWSVETEIDCYGSGGAKEYCSPNNYRGPAKDILYRNNGDGTFTDVSQNAGLHAAFGNGLGVVTGDFNEDGFIDVFVANDQTNDQLWLNQGDGTFLDLGLYTGTAVDQDGIAKAGMGVAAEDYDNDRDLDLLVVNLEGQTDSFFRNDGPYFTDHTALSGLGTASRHFTRPLAS